MVAANQQMRSTTNLLIINLAFADILFVIFCVPFTATDYILPEWPFGDVWCKCVSFYFRAELLNHYIIIYRSMCQRWNGQWLKGDFNLCFVNSFAGPIYDSGYVPCQRVYISVNVIWSIFSCCTSSYQHVIAHWT